MRERDSSNASVIALNAAYRNRNAGDPAAGDHDGESRRRRANLLAALLLHRVPEGLAYALADDACKAPHDDDCRALAFALEARMQARPIDYVRSNALMLRGLQGAGKSSVAAKIAVQAHLTGRDVRVLAPDSDAAPLRRLRKELGIKVVQGRTVQAIAKAIADARARKALVIVDTPGFNPRNARARAAFSALGQIGNVQSIAIVSALCDAAEMSDIATALSAERMIVTGLDMTRRAGALTVAATHKVPIAHVARSGLAGDGLEPITPLALANILLGVRARPQ
jgi:flagellar biosynthesis protein FlhF